MINSSNLIDHSCGDDDDFQIRARFLLAQTRHCIVNESGRSAVIDRADGRNDHTHDWFIVKFGVHHVEAWHHTRSHRATAEHSIDVFLLHAGTCLLRPRFGFNGMCG